MQIYLERTLNYIAAVQGIEVAQQIIQQGKIEQTKDGLKYLVIKEEDESGEQD